MSSHATTEIDLYPAIRFQRDFISTLFGRRRQHLKPSGRLGLGPGAKLAFDNFGQSITLSLDEAFSLQLSQWQANGVDVLAVNLRASMGGEHEALAFGQAEGARGSSRSPSGSGMGSVAFRVMQDPDSLTPLALPQYQPSLPWMRCEDFSRFWAWIREHAQRLELSIPKLTPQHAEVCLLDSPGELKCCLACNSFSLRQSEDGFECADCGYLSDSLVAARKQRRLEERLAGMSLRERLQTCLHHLQAALTEIDQYLPELQLASMNPPDASRADNRNATAGLAALQRALKECTEARGFASNESERNRIDQALEPLQKGASMDYQHVSMVQVHVAMDALQKAEAAVKQQLEDTAQSS